MTDAEKMADYLSDETVAIVRELRALLATKAREVAPDNAVQQLGFILCASTELFAAAVKATVNLDRTLPDEDGGHIVRNFLIEGAIMIEGIAGPPLGRLVELAEQG